jgi:DASS family divalent anion:Na+ symporter
VDAMDCGPQSAEGKAPPPLRHGETVRPTRLLLVAACAIALAFVPPPAGVTTAAWHLFAVFLAAVAAVVAHAADLFTASLLALAAAVLTGTVTPKEMYAGFSEDFILLIVVAFLISRSVIRSGLGARMALGLIRRLGTSTLGVAYSMAIVDLVIAPAFPSNTARSGVLYPITTALCAGFGADPRTGNRARLGAFLNLSAMTGISLSSALWLTAMAANPAGAQIAGDFGVNISFGSWLLAASLPTLVSAALMPLLLMRLVRPEITRTPQAPRLAAEGLKAMGPMKASEWITGAVFLSMVVLWALPQGFHVDRVAVALGGLGILVISGIYPVADLRKEGEALEIWMWFSVLYTLSSLLNARGFMTYLGGHLAHTLQGLPPYMAYVCVVLTYVLFHYLFVSQSAHLLALYGVFLAVARQAGAPVTLTAYMLLFATNFFSCITPQGSSANVLFAGSGFLASSDIYKVGGAATALNTAVFLSVGTAWILLVT